VEHGIFSFSGRLTHSRRNSFVPPTDQCLQKPKFHDYYKRN
jgi:hypothetical protein